MTPARKDKLRTLARLMNRQSRSTLPITGPLLDCFDLVITPDETDFLIHMGTEPFSYEEARVLCSRPFDEFREFIDTLLKKGLIWPRSFGVEDKVYVLAPFLVGWFELQLCGGHETAEKKEFARRLELAFQSWKRFNFFPLRNLQNYHFLNRGTPNQSIATTSSVTSSGKLRRIDVKQKITLPNDRIYPARSVRNLIEKYSRKKNLALMHCFCRQWRRMVDDPCRFDFPAQSCIVIGPITDYIVRYGFGRFASKEEALAVINITRKAGAVHTVFYEKDDIHLPEIGICNCCPDCCGLLGSYNRGIVPLQFKSHYLAHAADNSMCSGCGQCEAFCPVKAVSMQDEKVVLTAAKCIGCGQCVFRCPEEILQLEYKERIVKLPLIKTSEARW
jgi:ferredoxin